MKSLPKLAFAALAVLLGAQAAYSGPSVEDVTTLAPEPPQSPWSFEFVPYAWMSGIEGTTGVLGTTSAVDVGFDDILDNLDFAGFATFAARYERVGVLADFMYVKLSPSYETPGRLFGRTDLELEQIMIDLKATYRVYETGKAFLDIGAGARYFDLDLDLTFQPGLLPGRTLSGSQSWWDAVVGIRGNVMLSDRFFLTYLADVGAGESDLTWQAMAGIGYRFNDNVHLTVAYRYLDYDYQNGGFTYDVATDGIGIGLGFRW